MSLLQPTSVTPTGVENLRRHSVAALVILLCWIAFRYQDTGMAMVLTWYRSGTYTHGFLVPPIVLWLVWRRRQFIEWALVRPKPLVLIPVAFVAFVWLMGDLVAVNALTQLALVALIALAVPVVLGVTVVRQIIFPLAFLFFSVPIGDFVMPQLMEWTADFTVIALRWSGVPVYREGLQFVIPSGNWSVVEACSGVRYLIASITVGTLFAYLNYQSAKRRILFIIVSILVPIVANWLRAYMIVMLGHLSGNTLAVGVDHLIYGWVFFGIVIMLIFLIGARWSEPDPFDSTVISTHLPQQCSTRPFKLWVITVCAVVIVALPQLALYAISQGQSTDPVVLSAPTLTANWQSAAPPAVAFKPAFQNPSAEINSNYASQGRTVGLYVGYYRNQNYERKLVSSSNVLVTSEDRRWARAGSGRHQLALGEKTISVRTENLQGALATHGNNGRLLVWQFYWINGTLTSSDYLAKIYSAVYQLLGRADDSAVIVVSVAEGQPESAEVTLTSFMTANYGAIDKLLMNVRAAR
jgi:exosortase A